MAASTPAAAMDEAMKAYARGDIGQSQALLRDQIHRTRAVNARLRHKALNEVLGVMDGQLQGTSAAAPTSSAGRALVKESKFKAYRLYK